MAVFYMVCFVAFCLVAAEWRPRQAPVGRVVVWWGGGVVRWYCHSCVWWDGSDGSDLSHVMVTGNKGNGDKHHCDSGGYVDLM